VGFTTSGGDWQTNTQLTPLNITPSMRLDDAVSAVSNLPFGGTDCALPMLYALEKHMKVDAFVVYTDSETWAGSLHPVQALREYRAKSGIAAKLVVVGMVSNGFSIADPNDGGMLDVVGFDAAAPAVIADFIRG
jgi:60 kDa SS-A/Ro ribonucleoprotein